LVARRDHLVVSQRSEAKRSHKQRSGFWTEG